MTDARLAGKKIAVVVESQFIPSEIATYQKRFAYYGAQVDLVSRLWGQPLQRFYSTLEPGVVDSVQWIDVSLDFDHVDLDAYAAVIVAANYVFLRLSWSERDDVTQESAGAIARDTPAARFFRRAMENPRIIKGAPCHALGLLRASPELLAGRKVIYNKVMMSLLYDSGAIYTPCPPDTPETQQVVVDRDLVTNNSWHASAEMVDRIADLIVNPPAAAAPKSTGAVLDETAAEIVAALQAKLSEIPAGVGARPVAKAAGALLDGTLDVAAEVRRMTGVSFDPRAAAARKPILLAASKFGVWASELTVPAATLMKAGYKVKIASEDGSPPHLLGPSLDPGFNDGAWRLSVVSDEERRLALKFLDPASAEHALLARGAVFDLSQLAKPPQAGDYLRDRSLLAKYRDALRKSLEIADQFDAVVVTGGSGAIPGFMADHGLQSLILAFHKLGKPIMAECNGGLVVAQTIDPATGHSIISGRAVTTHSSLDEYQAGWGWTAATSQSTDDFWANGQFALKAYEAAENWIAPGVGGNPLIDSEALFRNAAGPRGVFFSPPGSAYSVVADGNLVTCRTTPDGYPGVLCLIATLDGLPILRSRLFIDADERGRPSPFV